MAASVENGAKRIKIEPPDESTDDKSAFAWKQCYNKGIADRLALKEYAVQRAEHHIYELCDLLRSFAKNDTSPGARSLRRWIEVVDTNRESHYDFEVLVGVAGQTGAGKTSLLNALLDAYELLPSGHEQAATAVACKVSWNKDTTPGSEARAEIIFQTLGEVQNQIINTLRAFRTCEAIEKADYEDEARRIDDRAEALIEVKEGMELITTVWQIPEKEVKDLAIGCADETKLLKMAEDFISTRNPAVLKILNLKTTTIAASDSESLGAHIKPYLDSTTAFHCGSTYDFAIWPLIRNVNIYLRSEILKNGICLVDLPGSGDNVESRAKVAEQYRKSLEVTLVVAAIIRAANEKSTHRLLSTSQEMKRAMDKDYNCKSFGVVLTKMDDMDPGYVKRSKAAVGDPFVEHHTKFISNMKEEIDALAEEKKTLQNGMKGLKSNIKRLRKLLKSVPDSAQYRSDLTEAEAQRGDTERRILEIPSLIELKEKEVKPSKLQLIHWSIIKRNAHVAEKLQNDFRRRHAQLHGAKEDEDVEEMPSLDVMPISSRKYWAIRQKETDIGSFPTLQYTGIPALIQWIHGATASRREEHLDVTLEGYRNALDGIDNWVKTTKTQVLLQASFDIRELLNALEIDFAGLQTALEKEFSLFSDEIAQINPFMDHVYPKFVFRSQAKKIASEWALKFFDDETATDRMAWNTYKGIALRRGGPFRSTLNKDIVYDWIPKLAQPLVTPLVGRWNKDINKKLPLLWKPRTTGVELILGDHFKMIMKTIGNFDPSLPTHLQQTEADVLNVQCLIRSEGSYGKRRKILENYVHEHAGEFFDNAWKAMKDELERSKYRAKQDLEETAHRAAIAARNPVELALGNLMGDQDSPKKMDAQNHIRARLREWCADWKFPSDCPTHVLQENLAIPSELRSEDLKACQEEDDEDTDSDSDDEELAEGVKRSVDIKTEDFGG